MWKNAERFACAAWEEAELVFNLVTPGLFSAAITVGVPDEGRSGQASPRVLCGGDMIAPNDLKGVMDRAAHWERQFVQAKRSVIGAGIPSVEYVRLDAMKVALAAQIRERIPKDRHVVFCSLPVPLGEHLLSVVLLLDKQRFDALPTLRGKGNGMSWPFANSLVDCVTDIFLRGCVDTLRGPDPGHSNKVLNRDAEDVLRAAGKQFMRASGSARERLFGLFRAFDELSSMFHEGRVGKGNILVVGLSGGGDIDMKVVFEHPPRVNDRHGFRKLVELASTQASNLVVTQGGEILGLGTVASTYAPEFEQVFEIRLVKHHTWQLAHKQLAPKDAVLMQVEYGIPSIPKPRVDLARLEDHLVRLFPTMREDDRSRFIKLIDDAAGSPHGTTVVIRDRAADEATRLGSECRRIKPTPIEDPLVLQGLTCIDGALLFDPLCICHAIGVILDGLTTKGGTPARGARYNSAIRYVGKHRSGVLVVVVSQDGMVDLVPALKPRLVRRSEVEAKIAELQGLQESRCQDVTRLGKVWGWFNERQTYLSPEHCDKVITIWNAILAAVPLPRLSAETGQDAPATWDECFAKEMEQARLRPNPGPPCAPSRDFDEADFIPE